MAELLICGLEVAAPPGETSGRAALPAAGGCGRLRDLPGQPRAGMQAAGSLLLFFFFFGETFVKGEQS